MEVSSSKFSFVLKKSQQESWQQFYIRAQAICTTFDRNPDMIAELEEVEKMSHYFVASRFMGCRYSFDVNQTLQRYFGDDRSELEGKDQPRQ